MNLNKIIKLGQVLVLATTVIPPIIDGAEKVGNETIKFVKDKIKKSNKNQENKEFSNKEIVDNVIRVNFR